MHFHNLTKEEKAAEKFFISTGGLSNSNWQRFSPNVETWGVIAADKYRVDVPQIPHDTDKNIKLVLDTRCQALWYRPFHFHSLLSFNLLDYYCKVQGRLRHEFQITLYGYTVSGEASSEFKQSLTPKYWHYATFTEKYKCYAIPSPFTPKFTCRHLSSLVASHTIFAPTGNPIKYSPVLLEWQVPFFLTSPYMKRRGHQQKTFLIRRHFLKIAPSSKSS